MLLDWNAQYVQNYVLYALQKTKEVFFVQKALKKIHKNFNVNM